VRTAHLSVITWPLAVISYRRFGKTYRSRNVGKKLRLFAS